MNTKTTRTVALSALLMFLIGAPGVGAQAGAAGAGALEEKILQAPAVAELLAYAYEHSPTVQAARANWEAVAERYRVVTGYPDPQLMFTYFPEPIETRLGPQDWNATLLQVIPFPGKLSQAGEVVESEARIARLELDQAIRNLTVQILETYHELQYIETARRVVAQNERLLGDLRKQAETLYGQDRAALLDVVKAQSQLAQLQYDALLLEELRETERTRLNALLNRPPGAQIGELAQLPLRELAFGLDAIYDLAQEHQEEIRMAGARIEMAEARVGLARYEYLPEFRLGMFYAGIGDPDVPMDPPDAGRDAVGIQAGMTLPIWFGKNSGRVQSARAEVARARALRAARVNETQAGIRSTYFRLQNAERLIRLYRDELIPQAARSLDLAETWVREGEGSFSDFVESESVWYNFQLALARAKADRGKFLAQLERLVGRSLTEEPVRPAPGETSETK